MCVVNHFALTEHAECIEVHVIALKHSNRTYT